jgi:hypothetical protein
MVASVKADISVVEDALRRWDPIGVIEMLVENELPPDEYDSYAPYILGMLQRSCSVQELQHHLEYVREVTMGMGRAFPDTTTKAHEIATELVTWWNGRK